MTRVLVIDDDPALLRALRIALEGDGYELVSATTGEQGIFETAASTPDVVVLDLGLPDLDGVAVCRRIREWSDVPIIVLSAADAEMRKVTALDAGANDYVTKPFSMAELGARVRAALRPRKATTDEQPVTITVGSISLDLVHKEAYAAGELVKLTSREFDVLSFLARNASKVCTNQMILDAVWGRVYANETQYVHAYVHRLRQKLPESSGAAIENAPGIGYVLQPSSTNNL